MFKGTFTKIGTIRIVSNVFVSKFILILNFFLYVLIIMFIIYRGNMYNNLK